MPAPASASRHYRRLQRLKIVTVLAARRSWSRLTIGGDWERQYQQDVGPQMLTLTLAAQGAAVREADGYVAETLNEMRLGPTTRPGVVDPRALIGVTGDGRPVETLLASAVGRARATDARLRADTPSTPLTQAQALSEAQSFIDTVAATLIADANRAAEAVAMAERPWVDGWVRMINPPCCSRCAILAGRFYLFNEGFDRHPLCDCYHAPAPSDPARLADLIAVNSPERYFESLSETEQDRTFTRAGAQAIREGADIGQVVNARRGMSKAQVFGKDALITTEGTTRRGMARQAMGGKRVRLMPETILQVAGDDRDEQVRLLRANGYILDTPARNAPAAPAEAGGSRGTGGPGRPSDPPDPGLPDEPDPEDREAFNAYWLRRQENAGIPGGLDRLEPHEVRFVERFNEIPGQRLEWVPNDIARPTNDFVWVSNGGIEVELKSTAARYSTISGRILDAVRRAEAQSVVKDNFVIDLADQPLTDELRDQLAGYNAGRRKYRIARLWVMSQGQLREIALT